MEKFICPKCKAKLELQNRSLVCNNSHCFDLAKEGYVNLLMVNSKKSKNPGDNARMMMARRAFFESSHYEPLAENLSKLVNKLCNNNELSILDLGCGEGYYSGYIKNHNETLDMIGLDISKVAIRYASKRYKDINFCVASAYNLPFEDGTFDILLRVYAPSSVTELQRVIKENGFLITVTPGERHLYQLRDIIYTDVQKHSDESKIIQNFKLVDKVKLKYSLNINELETIKNLLEMTPFGWKISEVDKEKLYSKGNWEINCDFNITIYSRDGK